MISTFQRMRQENEKLRAHVRVADYIVVGFCVAVTVLALAGYI